MALYSYVSPFFLPLFFWHVSETCTSPLQPHAPLINFCLTSHIYRDKPREDTGFAIVVTRIVQNGTADLDGRLQLGDIILSVDDVRDKRGGVEACGTTQGDAAWH